jgi:hypothetical protein
MSSELKILEPHVNWRSADVADAARWTVKLTPSDHRELDAALKSARSISNDLLEIDLEAFPLEGLADKLAQVETELIDGRGFVRISALDSSRYSDDDLTMMYWGIGMHLGEPWPQNKHGHVMGDVTDQGKTREDPHARGNEIGAIAFDHHTDGSDLVGLMCLRKARSGGLSLVANAVAIHNELVRTRPDLAEELYKPLPYDFRGEEPTGGKPFYMFPAFTQHEGRLFVRFIPAYIRASQRHAEAPRLSPRTIEAIDVVSKMAADPDFNVCMDLEPGHIQFVNNYHVMHGRTAYIDDPATGHKRHLKRLWLSTRYLKNRPEQFRRRIQDHWARNRSVSRIPAISVESLEP